MKTIHTLILLAVVLAILFWKSFVPGWVVFSNDGPHGTVVQDQTQQPDAFWSIWADANWLGSEAPVPGPSVSVAIRQPIFFPCLIVGVIVTLIVWRRGWLRQSVGVFAFAWIGLIIVSVTLRPACLEQMLAMSGFVFMALLMWAAAQEPGYVKGVDE